MTGRRPVGAFNGTASSNAPAERSRVTSRPLVSKCPTEHCGIPEDESGWAPDYAGWILVMVTRSTEPGRWFCSGECARLGMAIAELRVRVTPGGVS